LMLLGCHTKYHCKQAQRASTALDALASESHTIPSILDTQRTKTGPTSRRFEELDTVSVALLALIQSSTIKNQSSHSYLGFSFRILLHRKTWQNHFVHFSAHNSKRPKVRREAILFSNSTSFWYASNFGKIIDHGHLQCRHWTQAPCIPS
jgi:hypothetical protein